MRPKSPRPSVDILRSLMRRSRLKGLSVCHRIFLLPEAGPGSCASSRPIFSLLCSGAQDLRRACIYTPFVNATYDWYLALLNSSPGGLPQDSLPVVFVVQRV